MRWPWRRRGAAKGRVVFIGTSPFDVAAAIAAVPTPSPAVAAWIPEQAEDAPPEGLGVQLGFADGSVVTLADDDPRAVALRDVAATLVSGERPGGR
jgi:hypothetical protein